MSSPTHRARTAMLCLVSVCVALVAFASLPRPQHAATASSSASANPRLAPAHPGVGVRALAPTAGSITVNSTMDVILSTDGLCTLREAISSANNDSASGATPGECAAGSGDDTIGFSVTGTINLTGALPDINSNMTINGPGSSSLTVRRSTGGDYRIFTVGGSTVGISGLTITNGKTPDGSAGGSSGGPGGDGGGILNAGTLTLTDVTVTSNRTGAGGAGLNFGGFGGSGGGIANTGTLAMTTCTVNGNSTGKGGAGNNSVGDGGNGGGVYNSNSLTITNCSVNGNTAGDAGDTILVGGRGGSGGEYTAGLAC